MLYSSLAIKALMLYILVGVYPACSPNKALLTKQRLELSTSLSKLAPDVSGLAGHPRPMQIVHSRLV